MKKRKWLSLLTLVFFYHPLTDHTFCSATANRAQLAAVLSRYDETFLNAQ